MKGGEPPELVRVYEKIRTGIWAFAGVFELVDARKVKQGSRLVFKFKLRVNDQQLQPLGQQNSSIPHDRLIPTPVKIEVWSRDKGRCVLCGRKDNLHFDHIVPFSKGGTSLVAKNIQLLCARHNLGKSDRIE